MGVYLPCDARGGQPCLQLSPGDLERLAYHGFITSNLVILEQVFKVFVCHEDVAVVLMFDKIHEPGIQQS